MNPLAHVLTSARYPHRTRAVPPAEPPDLLPPAVRWRWCRACEVKWHGEPECWCCGKPVAGIGGAGC